MMLHDGQLSGLLQYFAYVTRKPQMAYVFLSICVTTLCSCDSRQPSRTVVSTSDPSRLMHDTRPVTTINISVPHPTIALPSGLGAPLRTVIGKGLVETDDHAEFGLVTGAAMGRDGTVAIMDYQARDISLFTSSGHFRYTIGRSGDGPGEFRAPVALDQDGSGDLYAFDTQGRVQVFAESRGLDHYARTVNLDAEVRDACVLDRRIVVNGMRFGDPNAIQVFRQDGLFIGSFAHIYRTASLIISSQLSIGALACMHAYGLVLFAPRMLPEIDAYTVDGRLAWWIGIAGFRSLTLIQIPRGSMIREPKRTYDTSVDLVASSAGDEAVLQIKRVGPEQGKEGRSVTLLSFLIHLNANRPTVSFLGRHLPLVLWWGPRGSLFLRRYPYPRIDVHTIQHPAYARPKP